MTFSRFMIVLRARWKLGLAIWLGAVGLAVLFSFLIPPKYTATSVVLVDGKQTDPVAGVALQTGTIATGYMATQADVATSETVVLRAIRALKLDEQPELRAHWQEVTEGRGQFEPWLAEQLLVSYKVQPARESNALTLAYTSKSAEFSAQMSNALMQAYIDTTLDLRVEPAKNYNSFFDQRSKQSRDALEQAQAKLSEYQRSKGLLGSGEERFDLENMRLTELSSQVTLLQSIADGASGRQGQAGLTPDRMSEVLSNPVVATLTTDTSRLQARLQELTSNLGDQHPQVVETRSNLAELRKRLDEAIQRASGSVLITGTVARSQLAQSQAALEKQRSKVLLLKAERDEAAVLQRDVQAAQRSYDLVLSRASQSDMESQNRQTNVSVLKRASPPAFPSSPKVKLNIALGFLVGLCLAAAIMIVRELLDHRLRGEEDAANSLNLQVLAIVPRTLVKDRRAATRLIAMKSRVLTGSA